MAYGFQNLINVLERPTSDATALPEVQQLATRGRGGDSTVGHLTPGEMVIPKFAQTPGMMALFAKHMRSMGRNPEEFRVSSRFTKRNPLTGAQEFQEGESEAAEFGSSPGFPGGTGGSGSDPSLAGVFGSGVGMSDFFGGVAPPSINESDLAPGDIAADRAYSAAFMDTYNRTQDIDAARAAGIAGMAASLGVSVESLTAAQELSNTYNRAVQMGWQPGMEIHPSMTGLYSVLGPVMPGPQEIAERSREAVRSAQAAAAPEPLGVSLPGFMSFPGPDESPEDFGAMPPGITPPSLPESHFAGLEKAAKELNAPWSFLDYINPLNWFTVEELDYDPAKDEFAVGRAFSPSNTFGTLLGALTGNPIMGKLGQLGAQKLGEVISPPGEFYGGFFGPSMADSTFASTNDPFSAPGIDNQTQSTGGGGTEPPLVPSLALTGEGGAGAPTSPALAFLAGRAFTGLGGIDPYTYAETGPERAFWAPTLTRIS